MKPHHLCLDTQLSVLELFLFKRKFGVFCSKIYELIIPTRVLECDFPAVRGYLPVIV